MSENGNGGASRQPPEPVISLQVPTARTAGDSSVFETLRHFDTPACLIEQDVDGAYHCLQVNERYLVLAQELAEAYPVWSHSIGLFEVLTNALADALTELLEKRQAIVGTCTVGDGAQSRAMSACLLPLRVGASAPRYFLATLTLDRREVSPRPLTTIEHGVRALKFAQQKSDPYTVSHQAHTANLAFWIATEMGLKGTELAELELGASLHDIGKIAIPLALLAKTATLTAEEMSLVRTHSGVGHEITSELNAPAMVRQIVRHHHECLDGSGYPDGLSGAAIALPVRIVSVADALEAMTTPRPYRRAFTLDRAIEELKRSAGRHHDGDVVATAEIVLNRAPHLLDAFAGQEDHRG